MARRSRATPLDFFQTAIVVPLRCLALTASLLAFADPAIAFSQRPAQAPPTRAAQGDESVRVGCFGGRTGGGGGNTLTRRGDLSAYDKPPRSSVSSSARSAYARWAT